MDEWVASSLARLDEANTPPWTDATSERTAAMSGLGDMIRQRDELNGQIAAAEAGARSTYAAGLMAIEEALEDWAAAGGHALSRSRRRHAETITVDGAVAVVLGYPCEECTPSLSVKWGDGLESWGGPHASFEGDPPAAGAVVNLVAGLLSGEES